MWIDVVTYIPGSTRGILMWNDVKGEDRGLWYGHVNVTGSGFLGLMQLKSAANRAEDRKIFLDRVTHWQELPVSPISAETIFDNPNNRP